MGAVLDGCSHRKCRWTSTVEDAPTYEREAPSINGLGRVHMIIFACDYAGTESPLSNSISDGRAMADLARTNCGVTSLIEHYERKCTPGNLEHAFGQISAKMQNDDYLVFFFSGHGVELASDGPGGHDDAPFGDDNHLAFQLFNQDGKPCNYSCSYFAELVSNSVNPRARVLLMLDCDYASSMADLTNSAWDAIEAICLSGHEDKDEIEESGNAGLFTMSLLYGLQRLQKEGDTHYSVGAVFNGMIKQGQRVDGGTHHFGLEHSQAASTSSMAWPLLLPTDKFRKSYNPPVTRHKSLAGGKVRKGKSSTEVA